MLDHGAEKKLRQTNCGASIIIPHVLSFLLSTFPELGVYVNDPIDEDADYSHLNSDDNVDCDEDDEIDSDTDNDEEEDEGDEED